MRSIVGLGFFITAVQLAVVISAEQVPLKQYVRPNIIVILTDDQDQQMNSVSYMPLLKKHIIDQGTYYKRHYCTTAICCPSRVSLWTGRNAHNTNVTDVFPPYGQSPHPSDWNRAQLTQAVTQNSSPKDSTITISQSGSKMPDITRITLASYSTLTP